MTNGRVPAGAPVRLTQVSGLLTDARVVEQGRPGQRMAQESAVRRGLARGTGLRVSAPASGTGPPCTSRLGDYFAQDLLLDQRTDATKTPWRFSVTLMLAVAPLPFASGRRPI